MDWTPVGTGVAAFIAGVGAVVLKLKPWASAAKVETVANEAEAGVITTLRAEVDRLSARMENLEDRCDKQARRIWQLEAELARHGIAVPA